MLRGGALLRRVEIVEAAWSYDAAMIAADGGGAVAIEIRQIGSFAAGRPAVLPLFL